MVNGEEDFSTSREGIVKGVVTFFFRGFVDSVDRLSDLARGDNCFFLGRDLGTLLGLFVDTNLDRCVVFKAMEKGKEGYILVSNGTNIYTITVVKICSAASIFIAGVCRFFRDFCECDLVVRRGYATRVKGEEKRKGRKGVEVVR